MKILVTGSEGNVGRKLVPYLRECGHKVLRLDIMQEYADDYIKHDVRDPLYPCDLPFKPEVVFHLAGMVSRITCEKAPHLAVDTNITETSNIVQFCKSVDAKMINFSTSEVYGNQSCMMHEEGLIKPNNIYGLTKYCAESIVKYEAENNGLKAVTLRPFMIYDENETKGVHRSAMVRFAEALIKGEKITVHDGSKRSWLHVYDAVRLIEKAIYVDEYCAINIGNPESVWFMLDIAKKMCDILKLSNTQFIKVEKLPDKMTLVKDPCLNRQKKLLKTDPIVNLDVGIKALLKRMKCE